jgi:hypothetical protein
MATYCFTPFRLPMVRVTALDSCGTLDPGACSTVATNGIITVEQTATYEDRVESYEKNGDGTFCVQETIPPILKWYNLVYTFCNVDPDLVTLMTGQPTILSDADTPGAIGNISNQGDTALVNFALEGWTRLANQADCATGVKYGYVLYPWNVEGTMGDVTYSAGTATFIVNARTKQGSNWGTGPYSVYTSQATATLGDPLPLLTSVGSLEHRRMFITGMAPPTSACGCVAEPLAMATPAHTLLVVTLTLPTGTAPAFIDWGDLSTTPNAAGPTAMHTYSIGGTYTITLRPRGYSSAPYVTTVTVAP